MGWKDAYQYVGKLLDKRQDGEKTAASAHHSGGREDEALPLGARIGSLVRLQQSTLIRALTLGSLVDLPGSGEDRILAISRVQLDMAGSLYRYYLCTGEQEKFLQLYCDPAGTLSDLLYCSRLTSLIPETVEDQQAFLGEAGYGLGDRSYTLWRDQVAELGFDDASLAAAFGESDQISYSRDAGDPQREFIEPFRGIETRIDDASGQHGLRQEIVFMPYTRTLGTDGQHEDLLISTEILQSRDGDERQRGIQVDFMIAVPLELERLVVQ